MDCRCSVTMYALSIERKDNFLGFYLFTWGKKRGAWPDLA